MGGGGSGSAAGEGGGVGGGAVGEKGGDTNDGAAGGKSESSLPVAKRLSLGVAAVWAAEWLGSLYSCSPNSGLTHIFTNQGALF